VGQFTIASAILMNAGRVFAIDRVASRLQMARAQGAEAIDFETDDPVEALKHLTGGIGPDRVIDAVGVDAMMAHQGPAEGSRKEQKRFAAEQHAIAPKASPKGELWQPGDAPSQVLTWMVEAVAKAGTLAIIGVYPETVETFPIGKAMNRNLTIRMGNCPHRLCAEAARNRPERRDRSDDDPEPARAPRLGDRRLQGVRYAPARLDEGGARAAAHGRRDALRRGARHSIPLRIHSSGCRRS
jgi:threonine dehydrogenase-like Zn-dependent dehydrogenase